MTIKLLTRETALLIGKALFPEDGESAQLQFLPNELFGNEFIVDYCAEDFVLYPVDDHVWRIPPYFVEAVYTTIAR